jgi:Ni,Fe-hydrogenase maturation factor
MPEYKKANSEHSRITILGVGDEGDGDAGLAPRLLQALRAALREHPPWLTLVEAAELQVEHLLNLLGADIVLFVEASPVVEGPCALRELAATPQHAVTDINAALTPVDLLRVYTTMNRDSPPPSSFALTLRGECFEGNSGLSLAAQTHLESGVSLVQELLDQPDPSLWRQRIRTS